MSRAADRSRARAEVHQVARLLGRDADQLAYLEALGPEDVRRLRDGITEVLYDAHDASLRKLAGASRLLPTALTATIAERAFGPLLSARLAGLLDLDRAVDVASRLPPVFLADVAGELDPRRASQLIADIPPRLIGQITAELARREDYVTMGRFVGHLGDDALESALEALDDTALLHVAFVLEDRAQLTGLLAALPEGRLAGIIAVAAAEGLWVQTLDLVNHLTRAQRRDAARATIALGEPAVASVLDAVIADDLWGELLLIAEADPDLRTGVAARLAALPAARRRALARDERAGAALERLGIVGEALAGA